MEDLGIITTTGESGASYTFDVYSWGASFEPLGAVYLITKRAENPDGGYTHTLLYVGQTGDLSERFDDHHKASCFKLNGANCISIHFDDAESSRLRIEEDLIAEYTPTCND